MGSRYFPWLLVLFGLFVFRVLAQLVQSLHPVAVLPPFGAWHGGVMAYPLLVVLQVVVIVALAIILWRVRADAILPRRWKYRVCFTLGGVYFAFMSFRLLAGLTFLADNPWFSRSLPAIFHVVLATFILLFGCYMYRRSVSCDGNGRGND